MLIYVAYKYGGNEENLEKAKRIVHNLQVADLENTYICPLLLFSHLKYNEIGFDEEMELCLDVLSVCDKLLVASETSKGTAQEIAFAKLVGTEVYYLEDTK